LTPSDYLSANEIAAASFFNPDAEFNVQTQVRVTWPADPVVARAYMDQLRRGSLLDAAQDRTLTEALDRAEALLSSGGRDAQLATQLAGLAPDFAREADARSGTTQIRYRGLAETLEGIAARLR